MIIRPGSGQDTGNCRFVAFDKPIQFPMPDHFSGWIASPSPPERSEWDTCAGAGMMAQTVRRA